MASFNILSIKDRKGKLKALSILKSAFEKGTLKLINRGKRMEVEESKAKVFPAYLTGLLRKSSIELIFGGYKLLVKTSPPNESIFPETLEFIAEAFKEILIFQCCLTDRAFWEVQCRRVLADKNLLPDNLNSERFSIMNDVAIGAFEAYKEFCELLGLNIKPNEVDKFLVVYENRMNEYAEMQSLFESKEPKETLLWEAGKKIANAMVGGPDIRIITLVVQIGVEDIISTRDFITAFFDVSIEDVNLIE